MRTTLTKILLFIVTVVLLSSCNTIKRVQDNEYLLKKNAIYVNDKKINNEDVESQIIQQPNTTILGYPFRLNLYNLANLKSDSTYTAWLDRKEKRRERLNRFLSKKQVKRLGESFIVSGINKLLIENGEAPVIIDDSKAKKTTTRLRAYYFNEGYFNARSSFEVIPTKQERRANINYYVKTGNPYFVDSLDTDIASKALDSLYNLHRDNSFVKEGQQFKTKDFEAEQSRLTGIFRNSGVYTFQQSSIGFTVAWDTISGDYKMPVTLNIRNLQRRTPDSVIEIPYRVHKVSKVNIYTDKTFSSQNEPYIDSTTYNGYSIYSKEKLRFRPKALTNAVFITPGDIYRDSDRLLTYKHFSDLRNFKYPNIQYQYADSTQTDLIANIVLTPRKRFSLGFDLDLSHSNIQDFGVSGGVSLISRNIFRGAETLEVSLRGTLGSANDLAESDDRFFNISEIGGDIKLNFPRIFLPFNTEKIVPKYMSPNTNITVGTSIQENIGLDKQNFTTVLRYNWSPSKFKKNAFELMNIEFVNNKNTENYFNVYRNSFQDLNGIARDVGFIGSTETLAIPDQANSFLAQAIQAGNPLGLSSQQAQQANAIDERKTRLTDNNLIFASNFTYTRNNKENLLDNSFSQFRTKIELAGNVLSTISNAFGLERNANDKFEIFEVEYSQYVKTELDYIKHWSLSKNDVLAFRSFIGLAIPYGNSDNIPFSRSYFSGGANDNRAWQAYKLGPGSSVSTNEFNEANFKLALNLEYRFDIFGSLKGAFFADAGNIWNVFDNVETPAAKFEGFKDLQELALGTGFGVRYDFDFFVFRLDMGFKTYDPSLTTGNRWFKDYNFANTVLNIGINYPF